MKITLTVNESQAQTILTALDLYSRLLMGQFDVIENVMKWRGDYKFWEQPYGHDLSEKLLKTLRRLYIPELQRGDSWGISHPKNPAESKVAYDILQVLRHSMAWHKEPSGGYTVDFGQPIPFSQEEMCKVSVEG